MTSETLIQKLGDTGEWELVRDGRITTANSYFDQEIFMEITTNILRIYVLPESTEKFIKVTIPVEAVFEENGKLYANYGTKRGLIPIDFIVK